MALLAVNRHVVDRKRPADSAVEDERRQRDHLEIPGERAIEAADGDLALDRREEADLAEVDAEHGHARAGEFAQRGQDRAVAAEREGEIRLRDRVAVQLQSGNGRELVLARLVRIEPERETRTPCVSDQPSRAGRVSSGRRWVNTLTTRVAFTAPPR